MVQAVPGYVLPLKAFPSLSPCPWAVGTAAQQPRSEAGSPALSPPHPGPLFWGCATHRGQPSPQAAPKDHRGGPKHPKRPPSPWAPSRGSQAPRRCLGLRPAAVENLSPATSFSCLPSRAAPAAQNKGATPQQRRKHRNSNKAPDKGQGRREARTGPGAAPAAAPVGCLGQGRRAWGAICEPQGCHQPGTCCSRVTALGARRCRFHQQQGDGGMWQPAGCSLPISRLLTGTESINTSPSLPPSPSRKMSQPSAAAAHGWCRAGSRCRQLAGMLRAAAPRQEGRAGPQCPCPLGSAPSGMWHEAPPGSL